MVEAERALTCEVDLCHLVLRPHESSSSNLGSLVPSGVKVNDCLIDKSLITGVKEVTEVFSKLAEYQIDYLGLHLGLQLLVKRKFLNNQVVVILKGFFHCF